MTNPSEIGMRNTLLLEMGKCIEELIQDPHDNIYHSQLLSLDDAATHLLGLGFKLTWPNVKHIPTHCYKVELLDGNDAIWVLTGGGKFGGVTLEREEEYSEEYEEDEHEYDGKEDEEEYEPEDDGKPL